MGLFGNEYWHEYYDFQTFKKHTLQTFIHYPKVGSG